MMSKLWNSVSVCSLENLNLFPTKTSSLYQPHYLPKPDPEDGHLISPIMEEVSKDNKLKMKIEFIKKMLTNWKVVVTANRREVKEKDEIESLDRMEEHFNTFEENFEDLSERV